MNPLGDLQQRPCPVCGDSVENATLFLDKSLDTARITRASFASRKEPEYMWYRLMRCATCNTVYAAEAPRPEALAAAYRDADYDTTEEAGLAAVAYACALRPALMRLKPRGKLVEIGAGSGGFLSQMAAEGFQAIVGIEPSLAARDAAKPAIRSLIREGIFNPTDFAPNSISMICCFQTLEHVADPRSLAEAAFRLLEPNGMLAIATHDVTAPINRLLGRRSPIFDIEHLQLFCPTSLRYLLTRVGFSDVSIEHLTNTYPLRYWIRLAPVPLKHHFLNLLSLLKLDDLRISTNVGNILTIAWKLAV